MSRGWPSGPKAVKVVRAGSEANYTALRVFRPKRGGWLGLDGLGAAGSMKRQQPRNKRAGNRHRYGRRQTSHLRGNGLARQARRHCRRTQLTILFGWVVFHQCRFWVVCMTEFSSRVWTICGCVDHCFAFALWCDDFAQHVDPEDMTMGLDRAVEVVSDATRLQSFLALRKLDELLTAKKRNKDDLIVVDLGIERAVVLGDIGDNLLSTDERETINKSVAHLTEKLTLDPDSEVELDAILKRSMLVMLRLVAELRKKDANQEAKQWLDSTEALIKRAEQIFARRETELADLKAASPKPV